MKIALAGWRRYRSAGFFSPAAFVARAAFIALLYGISELGGLREYTTFLSGTSANPNLSWETAALVGAIHIMLYLGAILVAPIFLIAAGLLAIGNRWFSRHSPQNSEPTTSISSRQE
jgi:hypothetical protein